MFDFSGNIIHENLVSKTATKLIREWIDIHVSELEKDWELSKEGKQIKPIKLLD